MNYKRKINLIGQMIGKGQMLSRNLSLTMRNRKSLFSREKPMIELPLD